MSILCRVALVCAALGTTACASAGRTAQLAPVESGAGEAIVGEAIVGEALAEEQRLLAARRQADSLQVVIASLALFKAVDPDVRRLAQTIVRDHMQTMSEIAPLGARWRTGPTLRLARDQARTTVSYFARMPSGPDFDAAFVDSVLAAHRHDREERTRLLPRIGEALRQLLDRTEPMLDLHLRLAEAVKRGIGR
ncbi:MAG TPA: DUF4142 domain-containing protein [Gemmatimonadaceae bacterium]|nr:DUF4142 domain-containing protein [Gemmatimonadaceae bacterium]